MNLKNLKHIIKEEISKLNEQKRPPELEKVVDKIQNEIPNIPKEWIWVIIDIYYKEVLAGLYLSGSFESGDSDSSSTPIGTQTIPMGDAIPKTKLEEKEGVLSNRAQEFIKKFKSKPGVGEEEINAMILIGPYIWGWWFGSGDSDSSSTP